ncbi:uncharacterized protein LOC117220448 [Megalopta genalis]|uniref:uncharacterized protein LOC117220448 n=1 Tax=Megalopta genalis TaxID=115081 RepID=UPI003FD66B2C
MAGIFNLFGSAFDLDKDQVAKPLSRANTTLGIGGTSLKSINQPKPKGLSMRSNSSLNVPSESHLNQGSYNKQQNNLKPNLTQLDSNGRPISPHRELLKKPNVQFHKMSNLFPKKISEKQNVQLRKPSGEFSFKKPLTPKNIIQESYPDPEELAHYYDMQFDFDHFYTIEAEKEFRELLMNKKNKVLPYEDEGFHSDPELITCEFPMLRVSFDSDYEERENNVTVNLPELSDDDIF